VRILFVVDTLGRTRHFRDVLASLAARGHTVVLATGGRTTPKAGRKGLYDTPGIEVVASPKTRTDRWEDIASWLRRGSSRLRYFDPVYADATRLHELARAATPKSWERLFARHPWVPRHWRGVLRMLHWAETLVPCDPEYLRFVRDQAPDLVLVSPLIEFGSYQNDYVKCAHRLGVPAALLAFSWDNLTNQGLVNVPPDRVLVWNARQEREAVEMQGFDADRVVVTGAPRFDEFFRMRPSTTREAFCDSLGLDPARPLILYLCSSGAVAPREVGFVSRWVAAVRAAAPGSWLRDCQVVVRPHPVYVDAWEGIDHSSLPGVAVWRRRLSMNSDQGLFDALWHSVAVVGLNTSAMFEAAIVGRPAFTVTVPEFAGIQGGTIHFHYLLVENGGVVSLAGSLDEHRRQLEAAPDRATETTERSQRFLREFVRPRGLDTPATDFMVEELERMATLRKRPTGARAWQRPARWALETAIRSQIART
jgi:hypothetical protein